MKTWRPQRREFEDANQVCRHIARNPGIKTLKVSPKSAANILKSMQAIQRAMYSNPAPDAVIVQIMGVNIEVDYDQSKE